MFSRNFFQDKLMKNRENRFVSLTWKKSREINSKLIIFTEKYHQLYYDFTLDSKISSGWLPSKKFHGFFMFSLSNFSEKLLENLEATYKRLTYVRDESYWAKHFYKAVDLPSPADRLDCSFMCRDVEKPNGCEFFIWDVSSNQSCQLLYINPLLGKIGNTDFDFFRDQLAILERHPTVLEL